MPIRVVSLEDLPSALVDRFDAGDGLLWTGAGVSRQADERRGEETVRVGLPGAWALQTHLKEWTTPPHPTPETLAELAGLYVLQHGRRRLNRLIRAVYGADRATPPAFYDLVAALPPVVRVFVTTNYDPFLERALAYRRPVVVVRDVGLERVTQTRPAVYKPHGDAQAPDGCVITTADYDAWGQTTGSLPAQLAALFLQNTVVAIGYRAQDDNFRRLLRAVNAGIAQRRGRPHTMYVVIPDAEVNAFAAYAGNEYDLVLVPATGEQFLKWLIAQLDDRRRAREAEALSRLIDPPGVRAAQEAVRAAYPTPAPERPPAADVPDARWIVYADALEALAREQLGAGREEEGLLSRAQAARAYRLGGQTNTADELYRRILRDAVERRRDAALADRLLGFMQPRDRGVGHLPWPEDDEVKFLVALSDVLQGIPGEPPGFLRELEGRLLAAPPVSEFDALNYRLERLRAEHAVTGHQFDRAAEAFGRAATWAPDEAHRTECAIRSSLFAGLHPDPAEAAAAFGRLRALDVPAPLEALRQRALGWLAALSRDMDTASAAFERSAALAVEQLNPLAASIGYRGSEWVDQQRPTLWIAPQGPGHAAYRLEHSAASEAVASAATVHGLLDEADDAIRRKRWREAWRAAARAARLAYHDINPAGVEQAEARLADVWLGIIESASDDYSLFWAAHYVGVTRSQVADDAAETWVGPLRTTLGAEAAMTVRGLIIRHLAADAVSRRERAGFLLLLADLAEFIDTATLSNLVMPAIIAGLKAGWGPNSPNDPARAACRLLQAVYEKLAPDDAARIRAAVVSLLPQTPFNRLEEAYLALAQATAMAPTPADGGESLASELLGTLDAARRAPQPAHFLGALHMALAAVAERGDATTRGRVITSLERETHSRQWGGIAVLAARGVPVPEGLADRYLREMTAHIRALTVDASPNAIGIGSLTDDARLTSYSAPRASNAARDDAIAAGIALIGHDGQWSFQRAAWVEFLARLLLAAPERIGDALPELLRIARGEYADPGNMAELMSDHPLSAIRFNFGSGMNLRARALVALGALWEKAPDPDREAIRSALVSALRDPERAVREGAVIGLASVAARPVIAWQRDALVSTLADPDERVRQLALEALVRSAGDASTDIDDNAQHHV